MAKLLQKVSELLRPAPDIFFRRRSAVPPRRFSRLNHSAVPRSGCAINFCSVEPAHSRALDSCGRRDVDHASRRHDFANAAIAASRVSS